MNKYQQMEFFLQKNHGYLFTSEVEKASISRTYLARFAKENQLEKVAKGIYISPDTWPDELYILQICNPRIVYWGETALYLHGLLDREYSDIYVSVPPKYNQTRLREQGVIVHQEKQEISDSFVKLCRMAWKHICTLKNESPGYIGRFTNDFRVHQVGQADTAGSDGSSYSNHIYYIHIMHFHFTAIEPEGNHQS